MYQTGTFHEEEPVQFTPCVERTTLSCDQRSRQKVSAARPPIRYSARSSSDTRTLVKKRRLFTSASVSVPSRPVRWSG